MRIRNSSGFNTFDDVSQRDYSSVQEDYQLGLTETLDDRVTGRAGENILKLSAIGSVLKSIDTKGASRAGYNAFSGFHINPMLGAMTSGIEQGVVNRLSKIKGLGTLGRGLKQGLNVGLGAVGLEMDYITSAMTKTDEYKNLRAGFNIMKRGSSSGSILPDNKVGNLIGKAMSGLVSTKQGSTGFKTAGMVAAKTVAGGMLGGLIGSAVTGGTEEGTAIGQALGSITGAGIGLMTNTAVGTRIGSKIGRAGAGSSSRIAGAIKGTAARGVTRAVGWKTARAVGSTALGAFNVLSYVDLAMMPMEVASDMRIQNQLEHVTGYQRRRQETFSNPANQEIIDTNVGFAANNEQELSYLLNQPNLARDAAYRYHDSNFGF